MTYAVGAGPSGWAWVAMTASVVLLAGITVGAYLLLSRGGGRGGSARHRSAERRLAEQLARGQITEQEYLHLRAEIDEPPGPRARADQSARSRRQPPGRR